MLGAMSMGRQTVVAVFTVLAFLSAPSPAGAKTVFHAICGDLKGQRVDLDPGGFSKRENWKAELYRAGPPPQGQGTLEFVSEDTEKNHVIVKWSGPARALPVVYKSDSQISLADVDESGVWIFTLLHRAGKVLITRQTTTGGPGTVGALLVADCVFKEK
jgi:hypothetical protein